jgi:hypothetical protein
LQKSLGAGPQAANLDIEAGARNKRILATPIGSNGATFLHFFLRKSERGRYASRADIFHDKNVITTPYRRCNDRPAAAELK